MRNRPRRLRLLFSALVVTGVLLGPPPRGAAEPQGEVTLAWHVTIAPAWFDPSSTPPQITPFGILYALHDALVRPLPGQRMGPSLAESWKESTDGLTYEFKLRRGLRFHNGDPLTTDDVKWSFERYRGAGAQELHSHVRHVEIVDPLVIRFHLKAPWPDFMTFYGTTATAAGLVVPKRYHVQVGEEGFRRHPIGAGPYMFVSHQPGVEVVLEAYGAYWRHAPYVKRLVMKSVPEATTRVAMLKRGDVDLAFSLDGEDAEGVRRDARLQLVPSKHASSYWIEMTEQWDARSPWADRRVRQAAAYALDRKAINDVSCLGYCIPSGAIVPRVMDFALQIPPPAYDPARARRLLAEAGYPRGFDAGLFSPTPPFMTVGETSAHFLHAVGIRSTLRTMERAAFLAAWREKKLRGLILNAVGVSGNAASRVEAFFYSRGSYAYGGHPDLDDLFLQQAGERNAARREALLHQIQQIAVDRAMFVPIMDYRSLRGVGPRLADHALDTLHLVQFPAYEEMRLR